MAEIMATLPIVESELPPVTAQQPQLRVGVLLDSLLLPNWACHILDEMQRLEGVELIVIAVETDDSSVSSIANYDHTPKLVRLWCDLDRSFFSKRSAHHDAMAPRRFTPTNGVVITSCPAQSGIHAFIPQTISKLRSMQLDVLLNLSSMEPTRELQGIAKHGLWWFGDGNDLGTDLFWLLYERAAVFDNTLNISSSQFGTATLPGCCCAADKYSLFRNLTESYWRRWGPVQRGLNEIRYDGQVHSDRLVTLPASPHTRPRNRECAGLLIRLLGRMLHDCGLKFLQREEWFIAFRKIHGLSGSTSAKDDFTVLRPPAGHFYADPFVIEREGTTYIFFEDYSYASGKAVISFITINAEGECSPPQVALQEDYHLAYPCLFQWNREIYLLPETKNCQTIQLYRALNFPHQWEIAHVLQEDVSAVDSTLLSHDGKFWLFTSGLNSDGQGFDGDTELFLFFSSSLSGPWKPHPKNPVVTDVRNCRGAGQMQKWNGQLIRPAQDCSSIYGHAVVLNHIDVLSENDYRETPIAVISPEWLDRNLGTHTFNCSRTYEVLDGRVPVSRFWNGRDSARFETAPAAKPLFSGFNDV